LRLKINARSLFAVTHLLNGVLNLVYSLAQTLVFARVLSTSWFSETILLAAVGLYLSPINASVARANFVLIRERIAEGEDLQRLDVAAGAFHLDQALMIAASFIAPLFISRNPSEYVAFTGLSLFINLSNIWLIDMQTMLIAAERTTIFVLTTLGRRLCSTAALAWLYVSRDFQLFCLLVAGLAVLFHLLLTVLVNRRVGLFRLPRAISIAAAREHSRKTLLSGQATIGEWTSLNAPYFIVSTQFGVGAALIAFDTGLKLVRVVLSITRILSEIAITRVSSAMHRDRYDQARRIVLITGGFSLLAAIPIVGALALAGPLVFHLLLGANDVVPWGAGLPFALAVVASVGFQIASHLVSHLGGRRYISRFTLATMLGAGAFALVVWVWHPSVAAAIWAFALTFLATSVMGVGVLALMLLRQPSAAGAA
jgi:O-antigen/teichoic acid export membrane protein